MDILNCSIDKKIEDNMGLVISIVNLFKPRNLDEREAYVQAGRIGLWKALSGFDNKKGALATYAWKPIRWEILKEAKQRQKNRSIQDLSISYSYSNKDRIWEFLPRMNSEQEEIVRLRLMGFQFREISKTIGQSYSYTKKVFYKVIKNARENYNKSS